MQTTAAQASIAVSDSAGTTREERRVLVATVVGTSIEWYDYFIYAQAAAAVFSPLFFLPVNQTNPDLALIISLATVGIAFLFRPLGAIVFGYLGDKLGRKAVLVLTLLLMGFSTALIGLLPTYSEIGVWAPILLITLRILQGFSAGGEWGGAALLAVEHAPRNRRSLFGSFPQIGVPVGLIMATIVLLGLPTVMGNEAFQSYGWRIPFLLSILLIALGYVIRRRVEESPIFTELQQRREATRAPLSQLFRANSREVLLAAFIFVGNNAAGYLLLVFLISYGRTALQLPPAQVLAASISAAAGWLVFTLLGGLMGDRVGQVRTFQIGYVLLALWAVPMWFLLDAQNIYLYFAAILGLALPLGLTYGPQAALYAGMFPARTRYSGVSIGYGLGSILGGAFAPMVAQWILSVSGKSWMIGIYLILLSIISFVAVSLVGRDPSPERGHG